LLGTTVVALDLSGTAAAQTLSNAADSSSAAQPNGIEEIVVTAQRRDESLERTPVAITALGATLLANRAVLSESDLRTAAPGLSVHAGADSDQLAFGIRGQTVDPFTGSEPAVLPYVNEVPSVNTAASSFYDLESIQVLKGPQGTLFGRNVTGGAVLFTTARPKDEIEGFLSGQLGNYDRQVLQGAFNVPIIPHELLFRIAGIIDKRDGFTQNLYDNRRFGDVDRKSIRGSLLFSPTDKVTNLLVADYSSSDGSSTPGVLYSAYKTGSTNNGIPLNSTFSTLFSPALDAAIGVPGAWNSYLAAHPKAYSGGLAAYVGVQQARGPYEVSLDAQRGEHGSGWTLTDILTVNLAENIQLKNIVGLTRSNIRNAYDVDGSPFQVEFWGPQGVFDSNKQFTEEAQILGSIFDHKLTYVTGAFYSTNKSFEIDDPQFVDLSPVLPPSSLLLSSDIRDKVVAGYGQGTYALDELTGITGLGFTAGARYTSENTELDILPGATFYNVPGLLNNESKTFPATSWQFGLQDQLNPSVLVYVVSRRSFRSGGFGRNGEPKPGTAAVGGNLYLPERATDEEVGSKFSGRIGNIPANINVSLYHEVIDNVQKLVAVSLGGVSAFTANVPQATIEGVEIDAQINPVSWLEFGGSLDFTNARFSNGETILFGQATTFGPYPYAPRWTGTAFSQVKVPLPTDIGTLSVRGDAYAQAQSYFGSLDNTVGPGTRVAGYGLLDFRVSLDDIRGTGWSVAAYIKNALDKTYYVGGLPLGPLYGLNVAIPGDRRTVFGEVKYRF